MTSLVTGALTQLVIGQERSEEWRKYEMILGSDCMYRCVIPRYSDIVNGLDIVYQSDDKLRAYPIVSVTSGGTILMKTEIDKLCTIDDCSTVCVPFGEYPHLNLPYADLEVSVCLSQLPVLIYVNVHHVFINDRKYSYNDSFTMRSVRLSRPFGYELNEDDLSNLYLTGFKYSSLPKGVRIVNNKGDTVLSYNELFMLAHNKNNEIRFEYPLKVLKGYSLVSAEVVECSYERRINYKNNAFLQTTVFE